MKILDTRNKKFTAEFSRLLKARAGFKAGLEGKVEKIFSAVEKRGLRAVLEFARKIDGFSGTEKELRVRAKELNSAEKELSANQIQAMQLARKRIERFHQGQAPDGYIIKEEESFSELRWIPLQSVGIYIPGGKAPLASTVLMAAIPAQIAGVKRIAMVTPADRGGEIHPAILFAAKLTGVEEIYRVGGAHAIALLSLGAGRIQKVDKIVGPGGLWVSAAKVYAQSKGLAGIDTLAGPSEIAILADGSAPAEFAIADLKAQLEHGQGGWAFLISTNADYLEKIKSGWKLRGKNLFLIHSRSEQEMIELANRIAPEHLEIHTAEPEQLLAGLTGPAAIYVGADSPVAAGDYLAGPNHCLPTGGRAAFDSPLGVWDFMKRQSVVRLSEEMIKILGKPAAEFAELEGLLEHSRSLTIRIKG